MFHRRWNEAAAAPVTILIDNICKEQTKTGPSSASWTRGRTSPRGNTPRPGPGAFLPAEFHSATL